MARVSLSSLSSLTSLTSLSPPIPLDGLGWGSCPKLRIGGLREVRELREVEVFLGAKCDEAIASGEGWGVE